MISSIMIAEIRRQLLPPQSKTFLRTLITSLNLKKILFSKAALVWEAK
jgi:hypothetical protein